MSGLRHPSEEVLLSRAAGRLGKRLALVVDAHLGACPDCRRRTAQWEAVGGALLEGLPPATLAPDALDRALARIERPDRSPPVAVDDSLTSGIDLSAALQGLRLGPRRRLAPGVWMRSVLDDQGGRGRAYLLGSGPGRRLLRHSHAGAEFTCVLAGGFTDETGSYGPGDFAEADPALTHTPRADPGGECVCLIASEGPMRMRGLIGRLLQPLFGV